MNNPRLFRDVDYIMSSNLVGKYHTLTSNISTVASADIHVNPLPTTWSRVGSSNTYTSGQYSIESTSSSTNDTYNLSRAFDNGLSSFITRPSEDFSIIITLPSEIAIQKVRTYIPDSIAINYVSIDGSNDRSRWTTLFTYNGLDDQLKEREFSNTTNYKYYRWHFTLDTLGEITVTEIQIASYTVPTKTNHFTLDDLQLDLEVNQRVLVRTPDYSSVGISANDLNGSIIDTILLPNRSYELMYTGSSYLAKEV